MVLGNQQRVDNSEREKRHHDRLHVNVPSRYPVISGRRATFESDSSTPQRRVMFEWKQRLPCNAAFVEVAGRTLATTDRGAAVAGARP